MISYITLALFSFPAFFFFMTYYTQYLRTVLKPLLDVLFF